MYKTTHQSVPSFPGEAGIQTLWEFPRERQANSPIQNLQIKDHHSTPEQKSAHRDREVLASWKAHQAVWSPCRNVPWNEEGRTLWARISGDENGHFALV